MFINIFKYKLMKAKIIKILYCYERSFIDRDYAPERMTDDPFGINPKTIFWDYDKHDSVGYYREKTRWIFDYSILIEYVYDNKTYTKKMYVNNTFRILNEGKTIKVLVERNNPYNVNYLGSIFDL